MPVDLTNSPTIVAQTTLLPGDLGGDKYLVWGSVEIGQPGSNVDPALVQCTLTFGDSSDTDHVEFNEPASGGDQIGNVYMAVEGEITTSQEGEITCENFEDGGLGRHAQPAPAPTPTGAAVMFSARISAISFTDDGAVSPPHHRR